MDTQQQARRITQQILQELAGKKSALSIPVGVSNRHVHLSRSEMDLLFGYGSSLTRMKALRQPGHFAAQETVTLRGPKGEIQRVRVLGPLRSITQVEISVADSFALGIKAPVRMSGELQETPGLTLVGPHGQVELTEGAIVAWRHIHISPEEAARHGLSDGAEIDVTTEGARSGVLHHVKVRVSADAVLEMHIDVEEANALGLRNDDRVIAATRATGA
ncbi:phosphate propanoyltransferase [Kalamiella sp. sgz302252]|uniref:phosphate propanoyltransferase n=1 Tax=Pantoea sp. sgz302252 TaxID=3341827 RepID=UPI0036D2B302